MQKNIIVLQSGVICWLLCKYREIVSYNVRTTEQGTIKLPDTLINFNGQLLLGSYYSHDGKKLLRLFSLNKFKLSGWHQLPNGDWAPEPVMIDIEEKLQSLDLENRPNHDLIVEFEHSCEKRNIVLLRISLLYRDLQTHTTSGGCRNSLRPGPPLVTIATSPPIAML
jgi:hypothetical protein